MIVSAIIGTANGNSANVRIAPPVAIVAISSATSPAVGMGAG